MCVRYHIAHRYIYKYIYITHFPRSALTSTRFQSYTDASKCMRARERDRIDDRGHLQEENGETGANENDLEIEDAV